MAPTPTVNRLQLGRQLKALRLRVGMNTSEAALVLHCTPHTYRRYERGEVTIPFPHLDLLLRRWNVTNDERDILEELREQAEQKVWYSEFRLTESMNRLVSFEDMAIGIRVFELAFVWGPLQTEAYARAVLRATNEPGTSEEKNERDLRLRIERHARLFEEPPELRIVFDESVLRRQVGGTEVMREQLTYLLECPVRDHLRVLPLSAPAHPGMMGAFYVFEFDPKLRRPAQYVEGPRKNFYLEDAKTVERASVDFAWLWDNALGNEASGELIRSVIEELNA